MYQPAALVALVDVIGNHAGERRDVGQLTAAQERRIGVLVRNLTAQRKLIWQKAQVRPRGDGRGWDYGDRRHRYHSLLARTA
jgi:hypothetical protein